MGIMLNLDAILDRIYQADSDSIEIVIAICAECECYHVVIDEDDLCEICRCLAERGELSDYLKERIRRSPRIKRGGAFEHEEID